MGVIAAEVGRKRSSGRAGRENVNRLLREYREHGDLRARERLIQQYMPLVRSLARRHSLRGEQYEDLVQVGCIGLIKAVDRFDPQRRVEFGAFAIPNVAGKIKRHLRDRSSPIRIPRRLQELRPALRACSAELSARLDRQPTVREIADFTGIAEGDVEAALDTERIQSPISLSPQGTDGDDDLYNNLRGPGRRLRARRGAGIARLRLPDPRRAGAAAARIVVLRRAEPAAGRARGRDLANPRLPAHPARAGEAARRDGPVQGAGVAAAGHWAGRDAS